MQVNSASSIRFLHVVYGCRDTTLRNGDSSGNATNLNGLFYESLENHIIADFFKRNDDFYAIHHISLYALVYFWRMITLSVVYKGRIISEDISAV